MRSGGFLRLDALNTPFQSAKERIFFGGGVLLFVDVHAVSWVGMLAGLRARRHSRAVASTVVSLILPPWLGLASVFMIGVGGGGVREGTFSNLIFGWFLFSGAYGLVRAQSAKRQLLGDFRSMAAGSPSGTPFLSGGSAPPSIHFQAVPSRTMS